MNRQIKTFTFICTFICDITGKEKQTIKEYRDYNYLNAKKGLRKYFTSNETIRSLLELQRINR